MEYVKIPNIYKREEYADNKLIEGEYATPELEFLANVPWVWTEKVDGTNVRVMWDGHTVTFGGRTDKAQIPAHLVNRLNELFGGTNKEEIFEQKFGESEVILFGEGFGEKIQKGGGLYGPVDFILFDVMIGNMWLKRETWRISPRHSESKLFPSWGTERCRRRLSLFGSIRNPVCGRVKWRESCADLCTSCATGAGTA